jgi:hypothetical protein
MTKTDFASRISACPCDPCRALIALRDEAGSRLRITERSPGRMCEIAVVAAAGAAGLTGDEVVMRRGAYQRHLGLTAVGTLKASNKPIHIEHAIKFSNNKEGVKPSDQPIHIGSARAYKQGDRYFLTWKPEFAPSFDETSQAQAAHSPNTPVAALSTIKIMWPFGPELIVVDLARLGLETEVTQTSQYRGRSTRFDVYITTSMVEALQGGKFKLRIHYDFSLNPDIPRRTSWWGTTTLILGNGVYKGAVEWTDDENSDNNGPADFVVLPSGPVDDAERELDADERAIQERDLPPTQKQTLIMARRGQGIFRARLLQVEPRCRLTGTADPAHLRASHIKPWAASTDSERLDGQNGLMLAPHIDHLFDRALITFEDDGTLRCLDDKVRELLLAWGIDVDQPGMRAQPFLVGQRRYLQEHRRRFEQQRTKV